ncbi:MAG: winged helix-turn-helix transcriptional regulator [Actinobacteria bacterium]|nr:winged helix-turn-helix transcriptional regulator [Actinomycetota bacterium]
MHADICKVFTSPKRLEIINILRKGEKSVGELAEKAGLKQSNLSQHLAILREKGVVALRKEGQTVFYSLANPKIIQACDIMREVLIEQLKADSELIKAMGRKSRK